MGLTVEEVVGKSIGHHAHVEDLPALEAAWEQAVAGDRSTIELRLIDTAGETHFLRATLLPLREDGELRGVQVVARDRTREHEIEERLRHAQRMEAIGRLAGGIAHDFSNLLLVIGSYTDLAMKRVRPEDPIYAELDDVRKASQRAPRTSRSSS